MRIQNNKIDVFLNKYTIAIILLSIGVFVGSTIFWVFDENSLASDLGNFLGGFLGAGLSIFTVLLVFQTYLSQKEELKNQIKELKEQREGFELTRAFDLIYRETESINNLIKEFEIEKSRTLHLRITDIQNQITSFEKIIISGALNFSSQFDRYRWKEFPFIDELYRGFITLGKILDMSSNEDVLKPILEHKINSTLIDYLRVLRTLFDSCNNPKLGLENYDSDEVQGKLAKIDFIIEFIPTPPPQ